MQKKVVCRLLAPARETPWFALTPSVTAHQNMFGSSSAEVTESVENNFFCFVLFPHQQ